MSLAARITRLPLPHDPAAGAEARAFVADAPPAVQHLVEGAAGCSAHLRALVAAEHAWLRDAVEAPEPAVEAVLAALSALPLASLASGLRQAKARLSLLVALADLGGVWPLETVTGTLTRLADTAVDLALRRLVAEEIRRGKLPGLVPEDAETAGGMFALAMGKMGAGELNYSSDIDLVCLFDETRFDGPAAQMEARAAFIRVTRRMTAMLSDRTAEGYVFRTDLRLRPDASVMPVCLSMEAAERYYEGFGRTWERAAYIKARPCAGDLAAGARFLGMLVPFVWRRHLDFAAIEDAHDMRQRISAHKGLRRVDRDADIPLEGHDMKLGQGGIREIEFFTQTRQLIAGGRDPDLRVRGTLGALERLADKGWVPAADAAELGTLYRAHREVEHRLQMLADAQTHRLPTSAEGFDRLARFMGEADTDALRRTLGERLHLVAALTEGFFRPGTGAGAGTGTGSGTGAAGGGAGATAAVEPALGERAQAIVARWDGYPALRSDRARRLFAQLRPELLGRLARAGDVEDAVAQFDAFLSGLPAGVQLFSLFQSNPQLVDLIVDICATAPRLAQYLGRNAGVLDAVIGGPFFSPWPGARALAAQLAERLAGIADYERKLDAARVWAREWHFRVGVHHLRGLIDAFEAGAQYADLAEAVIAGLWPEVQQEFARRHGPPPGRGAVILGMGSLGAQRLNAVSDLDLIVIHDAAGQEASTGPRPLSVTAYFARLTKALVTALTAPMSEGRLYEVDMRLRPSGRQGPVATALSGFMAYQRDEAWTWEHLALTRARPIAGSAELGAEVEAFRRALLAERGPADTVLAAVADMRARLAAARPARAPWDAKAGPGRLQEIELVAQAAALIAAAPARRVEAQITAGRRAGWPDQASARALLHAYRLCWRVHCAGRLLADAPLDPGELGPGAMAFLLREAGIDDAGALDRALQAACADADGIISRLLAGVSGTDALSSGQAGNAAAAGSPARGDDATRRGAR